VGYNNEDGTWSEGFACREHVASMSNVRWWVEDGEAPPERQPPRRATRAVERECTFEAAGSVYVGFIKNCRHGPTVREGRVLIE